jgi:hypothetical protein
MAWSTRPPRRSPAHPKAAPTPRLTGHHAPPSCCPRGSPRRRRARRLGAWCTADGLLYAGRADWGSGNNRLAVRRGGRCCCAAASPVQVAQWQMVTWCMPSSPSPRSRPRGIRSKRSARWAAPPVVATRAAGSVHRQRVAQSAISADGGLRRGSRCRQLPAQAGWTACAIAAAHASSERPCQTAVGAMLHHPRWHDVSLDRSRDSVSKDAGPPRATLRRGERETQLAFQGKPPRRPPDRHPRHRRRLARRDAPSRPPTTKRRRAKDALGLAADGAGSDWPQHSRPRPAQSTLTPEGGSQNVLAVRRLRVCGRAVRRSVTSPPARRAGSLDRVGKGSTAPLLRSSRARRTPCPSPDPS